jgi:hypothetical protein
LQIEGAVLSGSPTVAPWSADSIGEDFESGWRWPSRRDQQRLEALRHASVCWPSRATATLPDRLALAVPPAIARTTTWRLGGTRAEVADGE